MREFHLFKKRHSCFCGDHRRDPGQLRVSATPALNGVPANRPQHKHGIIRTKTPVHDGPVHYGPPVRNFTTVVIDAGHGGHDNGGIFGQRIPEKPYTLDVAIRLRAILRQAGFVTVMTRSNDTFIPLQERVRIANAQHSAIFVSIHFNSSIIPTGHGIETYYYAPNAQPLAARIQARVMRANPGTENRGVKSRGYFVLRRTSIPSVLVEGGFLTNGDEARLIQQSSFRQRLAQMIAQAIIEQRGS